MFVLCILFAVANAASIYNSSTVDYINSTSILPINNPINNPIDTPSLTPKKELTASDWGVIIGAGMAPLWLCLAPVALGILFAIGLVIVYICCGMYTCSKDCWYKLCGNS